MEYFEALGTGLELVPVPAVLSDLATGTAINANAAAVELLGTPVDHLIGTDVTVLVHPDERAQAGKGVAALASGAVDALQALNRRVVRADGVAVAVDISGRRLESEARRLALWVFTQGGPEISVGHADHPEEMVLAVTDHDWQVQYLSAGGQLVGTAGAAPIGTALLGLVHPSAAAAFLEAASRAVEHRLPVSLATPLRSEADVWTERNCLLAPMCEHDPPRLGIVVTPTPVMSGDRSPDVTAAHVHHTAVDTRAVDALGTLATMTARPGFPELSARQIEILSRIVLDDPVDDIAAALYLSPSTVRNHLTALYRKFGVHSRAGLLAKLLRTWAPPSS